MTSIRNNAEFGSWSGVILEQPASSFGAWPVEAAIRVHTEPGAWRGLGEGSGLLATRDLNIHVEAKGIDTKRFDGNGAKRGRFARAG